METDNLNPLFSYLIWFVIFLSLFHIPYLWAGNLTKKQWKYVDYAWLFIGLLSIISLSGEIRQDRADVAENLAFSRVATMHELFVSFYVNEPPTYFCRIFVKRNMSPSNFDKVQKEFDKACEWSLSFANVFMKSTLPNYENVSWDQFNPPNLDEPILKESLMGMKRQLSYYIAAVDDLQSVREAKVPTTAEMIFIFMWPYFFVLAVALRIAKTTGEIRLER